MRRSTRRFKQATKFSGPCFYCQSGREVDYKDVLHLKRFLTRRGKIHSREQTGLCSRHQRQVAQAVKQARIVALLPFVER